MADYGYALERLKAGQRVMRSGWNGKGMWLIWVKPADYLMDPEHPGAAYEPLPWIGMKTADDKFVPWVCSQTDAAADDWHVVP